MKRLNNLTSHVDNIQQQIYHKYKKLVSFLEYKSNCQVYKVINVFFFFQKAPSIFKVV